jgi:hypothetical protein
VGGTLYGLAGNSAYTIDPSTGTATLISGVDLGFGSDGGVHGAASTPEAVPEPSSLALVVLGALTGIGCGWRQRRSSIDGLRSIEVLIPSGQGIGAGCRSPEIACVTAK